MANPEVEPAESPLGALLVVWTIRLALVGYGAALFGWLDAFVCREAPERANHWPRWAWTAGCLCGWTHLAAAFQFVHGWSNASAVAATAAETQAVLGVAFGGGVYFNYLFGLLWTADVARLWITDKPWPRGFAWFLHGYLFLIVFSGAIVFEPGATRYVSLAVLLLAACILAWRWRQARIKTTPSPAPPPV